MAEHDPVARIMALADEYAESTYDVLEREMNGTKVEIKGARAYLPVARTALETAIRTEVARVSLAWHEALPPKIDLPVHADPGYSLVVWPRSNHVVIQQDAASGPPGTISLGWDELNLLVAALAPSPDGGE